MDNLKKMKILAIETSCDETAAACIGENFEVLSNVTKTHVEHSVFGGVVPEIASRVHTKLILPVVRKALEDASLSIQDIDGIAVTYGPGLIGSLLVGLVFGKTLAQVLQLPFIGVNHLEGHLFSIFLNRKNLAPPLLFLLVSGGHTELIYMEDYGRYKYLGGTLDDAAGEAFDKVAKMLGLPYPGGPHIDRLAREGRKDFVRFPRARTKGYDFSFSGLKTAVLYYLRKQSREFIEAHISDIAASFQEAVVDMLLEKTRIAMEELKCEKLAVVGGVSMNSRLREVFNKEFRSSEVYFPEPQFTIDNAAMIGAVGMFKLKKGEKSPFTLGANPNLKLT